ncbi:hypothetical protein H5410_051537 [Solanum commersonii]|uniref:HTH myb-type domain-containing protein n=1 Tax=Solanum commersonii TaxID=4109 RepID=A0A9J5X0Z9_SOLCO|nr:hypothetical protein H5410_051537 [Solanum commersonii]
MQKLVEEYEAENWSLIGQLIPNLFRKSCRLWWRDNLSPQVDHQPFTLEEDNTIIKAYAKFGSSVVSLFPHNLIRWNFAFFSSFTGNADPSITYSARLIRFKSC